MTIRVLTADDHPVVRAGITAIVANQPDMSVVAEAVDGLDAVALYDEHYPSGAHGSSHAQARRDRGDPRDPRAHPEARVVALTSTRETLTSTVRSTPEPAATDQDMVARTSSARSERGSGRGSSRPPSPDGSPSSPRVDLTPRELEVLRLTAKGLRNRDIARVIGRTEETVKVHLKHIMAKLGVEDRTEAVTLGLQRGIIHLDD